MSVTNRLMKYCMIDTQSDPTSGLHPSSEKQFNLAHVLVEELKELGIEDAYVDEHCYVYGHLDGNTEKEVKAIGFIAHMDTAPDFSGTNVKPRIIENFDGTDIQLNPDVITKMSDFPYMKTLVGKTLMVTDGNTLLGADDKAGIASIMEALSYWKENPDVKHGPISIAFTPDEEIGEGPMFFNYEEFNASFAYTMDGDAVHIMSDETFNAASAVVDVKGFSIHPGEAKNKMINAASIATEFQSMLPKEQTPEHTEGKEGFIHLHSMQGNTEEAKLEYIIRDHDETKLVQKEELLKATAQFLNQKYGNDTVKLSLKRQYRNMKVILDDHPEVSSTAWKALKEIGCNPVSVPIRGGTDGAELSFNGLPCPNLGNGGGNFHGRYEYCVIEELELAVQLICKIAEIVAQEG